MKFFLTSNDVKKKEKKLGDKIEAQVRTIN